MTRRKIVRNVFRSKDYDDLAGRLGSKEYAKWKTKPKDAPLFGTIRELMCFAALLGFQKGTRIPLGANKTEVPEEVFEKSDQAMNTMRMIALAETEDPNIFDETKIDDMVKIFEEYANGGFSLIQAFLDEYPSDMLGAESIIHGLKNADLLPGVFAEAKSSKQEPDF